MHKVPNRLSGYSILSLSELQNEAEDPEREQSPDDVIIGQAISERRRFVEPIGLLRRAKTDG